MKTQEYNCIVCLDPVTNPICINCYLKQISLWLSEQKLNSYEQVIIMSQIKRKIPKTHIIKDSCILCHKNEVALCSYCFFLSAITVLYELNVPKDLIDSFRATFNYSLWHEDYLF